MIDNLISDPIKQILINLELYFESYEYFNFQGFFELKIEFSNKKLIFFIFISA